MARGRRRLAACILLLDLFRVDASWVVDSGFHHPGTWASILSIDPSRAGSKSRSRLHRRAPSLRPGRASRDDIPGKPVAGALLCRETGGVGSIGRYCRRWGGVSFVAFPFVFPLSNPRSRCCSTSVPVLPAGRQGSSRCKHIQTTSQQQWWPHPGSACCRPQFMARQGGGGRGGRRYGTVSMAKEGNLATTTADHSNEETPLGSPAGGSSSSVIGKEEEAAYVRPEVPTWKHKAVIIPG